MMMTIKRKKARLMAQLKLKSKKLKNLKKRELGTEFGKDSKMLLGI